MGDFADRWGWVYNIDIASKTAGVPWDTMLEKTAIEWLNIVAYTKDRDAWEAEERERWQKLH